MQDLVSHAIFFPCRSIEVHPITLIPYFFGTLDQMTPQIFLPKHSLLIQYFFGHLDQMTTLNPKPPLVFPFFFDPYIKSRIIFFSKSPPLLIPIFLGR